MVLDTSALIAILWNEPEQEQFEAAIYKAPSVFLSAASYFEVSMVIAREGVEELRHFDELIQLAQIVIEPVTEEDALLAREAFLRFGKGRHRARLNFGDCFSYALAQRLREPLLFKGDDFIFTDVLKV